VAGKSASDCLARNAFYPGCLGWADFHIVHTVRRARLVSCRVNGSVNVAHGSGHLKRDQDIEDLGRALVRVAAFEFADADAERCRNLTGHRRGNLDNRARH
jgi:hypothetical protein